MTAETIPLQICHALTHDGALHVLTTDGRLWRQVSRMGETHWEEVSGPEVETPAWTTDFDARR